MTFQEYENIALETAIYPGVGSNMVYPALGLMGESGEYADKVKKYWRNSDGKMSGKDLSGEQALEFAKELSDILWYLCASAKELGFTLEEVVHLNIEKLRDRRKRGVIKGTGDNR